MDPILEYLLEYNIINNIEYSDRLLIPKGGLKKMLDEFNGYNLNKVEVTKDELVQSEKKEESTIEELYNLLDE